MKMILLTIMVLLVCSCTYEPEKDEKNETEEPTDGLTTPGEPAEDKEHPTLKLAIAEGERIKVDFGSDTGKTLSIEGLANNSLYLLKVNHGEDAVDAAKTGSYFVPASLARGLGSTDTGAEDPPEGPAYIRTEHLPARTFDPRLLPITASRSALASEARVLAQVGDTNSFWVQDKNDKWTTITASLRATSTHSNVWIATANYDDKSTSTTDNKFTTKQAEDMALQFDFIYEKETPLFGFEYGGGVGATDPTYGGLDGDPKIQILVYDIDYDYSRSQSSGTFGYFWSKDYYTKSEYRYSNACEMFYLDAHFSDAYPNAEYSTLAHEFQHMINFNEKYLKRGKYSEAWFEEMLSQLAEDVIGPFIGINVQPTDANDKLYVDHPVNVRMPLFLASYWTQGPTEWYSGDDFEKLLVSYSSVYAFGAYLARNYGGTDLIQSIMQHTFEPAYEYEPSYSTQPNVQDLDFALRQQGSSFQEALAHYGEALVFFDSAHSSFNKTVARNIAGTTYTFEGFDLGEINLYNAYAGKYYYKKQYKYPTKGPVIIDASLISNLGPYAIFVQSCEAWQKQTGTLDIKLNKPTSAAVDFYIMLK